MEEALARGDVGILLGTKDAENFVVFVDGLAEVPLLLLIPPAAVGVSECSLHTGRVAVATVLRGELDAVITQGAANLPHISSYLMRIFNFGSAQGRELREGCAGGNGMAGSQLGQAPG